MAMDKHKTIYFDNLEQGKNYFAIEVKGDCMRSPFSPMCICDGDVVAVYTINKSEVANYLDRMVVIQLKSGLFAIKHLCDIKENSVVLQCYNPFWRFKVPFRDIEMIAIVSDVQHKDYILNGECNK